MPLCSEHVPADDQRCDQCEEGYKAKNVRLQQAADGQLHAVMGRFSVGLITTLVLLTFIGLPLLPTLPGHIFGSAAYAFIAALLIRWYRRTPPRSLSAKAKLRKKRKKFLGKRAAKQLPPARALKVDGE